MRVALINDGTYPYRASVGGTWTHRLVRGLPEHAFHLVTVTDRTPTTAVFYPPANTLGMTSIVLGGPGFGPTKRKAALAHRRAATHAAVLLCRSMLEDTAESTAMFRSALRRLARTATEKAHPLHGVPLGAVLFDAWNTAATARPDTPARLPRAALPRPTSADADHAADLLERALRPLSAALPLTELNHATDSGLAALVALGGKWRSRTPYVLTEHETYLDAPLLAYARHNPGVRAVLLRFFRALARLAYQEAGVVAATTERWRSWALDHGADRERLSLVPYGVDPYSCAIIRGEPIDDTITWLGPEPDLRTMVHALPGIRAAVPDVHLLVAGPAANIDDRDQAGSIGFLGPVNHRRSAYATGKIVVLSGADAAMPYALIEAMMCGRPTIVTGDGDLARAIGMGALVIPPDDAPALTAACVKLLTDRDRRRQLSIAAGQRARSLFALRSMLDRFRDIYERAGHDAPAATESLTTLPPVPAVRKLPPRQGAGPGATAVPPAIARAPVTGAPVTFTTVVASPADPAPAGTRRAPIIGVPATIGSDGAHDYWAVPEPAADPAVAGREP